MRQKMQEEAEQRRQEALAAAEELKKKVRNIAAPNVQSFDTFQVKAKPRTPPPVDEAAERERAALGDKISQLQERMRLRKEELAKQKDSETQAAAAGPSLSELEKQKMEKMRQFIAQARDAKGIAPGQSALSSLGKPGMLSILGGFAEGSYIFYSAQSNSMPISSKTNAWERFIALTLQQVAGKSCWNLLQPLVLLPHFPLCDRSF